MDQKRFDSCRQLKNLGRKIRFSLNHLLMHPRTHASSPFEYIFSQTTKQNPKTIKVNVAGKSKNLEPTGADVLGINLPFGELLNAGSFETTFLDDSMRVSRSKTGPVDQLRLFVKAETKKNTISSSDDEIETDDDEIVDDDDDDELAIDAEVVGDDDDDDEIVAEAASDIEVEQESTPSNDDDDDEIIAEAASDIEVEQESAPSNDDDDDEIIGDAAPSDVVN